MARPTEQHQHAADDEQNDAQRPEDSDAEDGTEE
jgi:hypothetical protein